MYEKEKFLTQIARMRFLCREKQSFLLFPALSLPYGEVNVHRITPTSLLLWISGYRRMVQEQPCSGLINFLGLRMISLPRSVIST